MQKGLFVTLEGIEGAGKSSNVNFIQKLLRKSGRKVETTREPGGTEIGEEIRKVLLKQYKTSMSFETELLLMFAARCEHIDKVIRPNLEAGNIVLCDRFTDATYAYQGGGRGIPRDRIKILEKWVQNTLRPDLTILFDISHDMFSIELGLARARNRGELDRFELEDIKFFENVRSAYHDIAKNEPSRIKSVNAKDSKNGVKKQLKKIIHDFLDQNL